MVRGVLIAIEGIDGAGKTTQAYMLVERLRSIGLKAEYTMEPTYGRIGDILRLHVSRMRRREPIYEALLYAADRFEHVKFFIKPKLRNGCIVVSDRYLYSNIAYQGAAGVDEEWIRKLNFFAPKPDLTIYIDIKPREGLKRKKGEKSVFEKLEYEEKVRKIYLKIAKSEKFIIVDGVKDVKAVHEEIFRNVCKLLRKKGFSVQQF
ncbi:MAG: dTMP kinase [Candidatus Bathyarchaeota archaeon]